MINTKSLSLERTGSLFGALSDPVRLRVLILLAAQELFVCELTKLVEIPQPTLSNHLRVLREVGLVVQEARGRWRLYRLGDIPGPLRRLLAELLEDKIVKADMENLQKYLREGRVLCGEKIPRENGEGGPV